MDGEEWKVITILHLWVFEPGKQTNDLLFIKLVLYKVMLFHLDINISTHFNVVS
jgi:hypothetical protein